MSPKDAFGNSIVNNMHVTKILVSFWPSANIPLFCIRIQAPPAGIHSLQYQTPIYVYVWPSKILFVWILGYVWTALSFKIKYQAISLCFADAKKSEQQPYIVAYVKITL